MVKTYSDRMDRVGIRELRNQVASVVRRAGDGERIVITVDGQPVAQLGPLEPRGEATIEDLIAAGLVVAPSLPALPDPPEPVALPIDVRPGDAIDELR